MPSTIDGGNNRWVCVDTIYRLSAQSIPTNVLTLRSPSYSMLNVELESTSFVRRQKPSPTERDKAEIVLPYFLFKKPMSEALQRFCFLCSAMMLSWFLHVPSVLFQHWILRFTRCALSGPQLGTQGESQSRKIQSVTVFTPWLVQQPERAKSNAPTRAVLQVSANR